MGERPTDGVLRLRAKNLRQLVANWLPTPPSLNIAGRFPLKVIVFQLFMAHPTGVEPVTSAFGGQDLNLTGNCQLSVVSGSRNQYKARYLNEIAGFPVLELGPKMSSWPPSVERWNVASCRLLSGASDNSKKAAKQGLNSARPAPSPRCGAGPLWQNSRSAMSEPPINT